MCLLMVIHKGVPRYPMVVVANRDEYYDRPTQGPHRLAHNPVIWGGRDTRAGGTWLGVNAHGLVIGLTNRRTRRLLQHAPYTEWQCCLPLLEQVCRDHESGVKDRETICMHRDHERYGTVSSTILALTPEIAGSVYHYAAGQPCIMPYKDYSSL